MKELIFVGPKKLEWREGADLRLRDQRAALVRPLAVAVCDLDWETIAGRTPFKGPFGFGHEAFAEVIEVGTDVTSVKPGDHTVVPFQISCGCCTACGKGWTADCETVENVARTSMYGFGSFGGPWGGALADMMLVPYADAMLFPLSHNIVPAAVASVADNASDGWRAVAENLDDPCNSTVLVVGGGLPSIGLYAVAAARALQVPVIDYVDSHPDRLSRAEKLGARVFPSAPPKKLGPYDLTIDASHSEAGLECAISSTRRRGRCQCVSLYYGFRPQMPLIQMYAEGIDFRIGRAHARTQMPQVIDRILDGTLRTDLVTSREVDWDNAIEALLEGTSSKLVIMRN